MIDFAFTAEQEDFRKELRRFAVTELAPRYLERAVRGEFCWTAHRQLAELGVLADGTAAIQKRIIATSLLGKVAAR